MEFYTAGTGWSQEYPATWTPDLYPRMHLLPNGQVFYSGALTASKLFDPSTTIWNTHVATTIYSGNRTYGTSVLLPLTLASNYDPNVIIMGGHSPATNTTEIIDLGSATPAWKSGPNMSQGRIEMNAVILPDGRVLAVGGSVNDEDTSTASLNADLLAPDPNNSGSYVFSSAGTNSYARLYHSVALLLPDATVWLAGGNPKRGGYVQQMEIYQPPYLFDSTGALAARPSITGAPSAVSYGNAFSVQTPDAATINRVVLVRNGTVTHAFGMDQREVELAFTRAEWISRGHGSSERQHRSTWLLHAVSVEQFRRAFGREICSSDLPAGGLLGDRFTVVPENTSRNRHDLQRECDAFWRIQWHCELQRVRLAFGSDCNLQPKLHYGVWILYPVDNHVEFNAAR